MARKPLVRVLADLAETAAETLELQAVLGRVASSVRELIPFDHMAVVRVLDGRWAVFHASTVPCQGELESSGPMRLDAWSPRFRPRPGPIPRVEDAGTELDPAFPGDARILSSGAGSCLWAPFHAGEPFTGGVWLAAGARRAFTAGHQEALAPIAALLGSAVEHWRIWEAERRRRERLDRLDGLQATLASSLDVREVFARLAEAVQPILAHDVMLLSELDVRARTVRVAAFAGESDIPAPEGPITLTAEETEGRAAESEIIRDIPAEIAPATERERLFLATGMRSWLRVPVWLGGEVRGSLGFLHREPARYDGEDAEVARRLADRVALMLAHHRLAEEARLAAEAQDRAERLEATVASLARHLWSRERQRVVGESRPWQQVLGQVARVAASETTVLITGESGTGKEVVAHLIHQGSRRAERPFVAVNCAALPDQLLESELFGHEKGAFTGAVASKIGRLEQAAGGTLFLDEIGEMSPAVQAKLLRALEQREFQRVGGTRVLTADVRLVAATNRELAGAIAAGQLREDLYYRLAVFTIHTPPLRERGEDVLLLAETFLQELGGSMGRPAAGISRDAREWLLLYHWPGNVRELRNAIERAILLCDGGLITRDHLPAALVRAPGERGGNGGRPEADTPLPPGGIDLEALEQRFVEKALRESRGNKSKAARLLGLTRAQLYTRLDRYGLG